MQTCNTLSIIIFCLDLKSPKNLLNPFVTALEPDYWHVPEEPDWCKEAVDCAKPGAVQTCPVTCSETGKGNDIMLNKESFANSFMIFFIETWCHLIHIYTSNC